MAKTVSLKKNFIMNALLTMSAFIFPIITFPYVSRVLGPSGTGRVGFATSFISYFAIFSQLGIPTYGIRACAQVRDDRIKLSKTVHELLCINLMMCALAYIVFFVALAFVPRLQDDKLLYIIMSSTMLFNAIGMEWLYKGLEQYTYITIRSLIFKAIALLAMFLLVHTKSDYIIYGAITIFAASASNIMNFLHAHRYIDVHISANLDIRRHWKAIAIFFAMSCATTVYLHLDVVMLFFMKTDIDVGYYNAAVKIKQILVSVITSLGTVLLPRASYYVEKKDIKSFRMITAKALNFVVLVSVPLTVFFVIFASQGIFFLSGHEYAGAIVPMQIIMPTLFFIGITNIMGIQVLVPIGKEKIVLYSEIAGAFTDLVLNAILIPRFASIGAAIGTLAAEFVVLCIQYRALKDEDISEQLRKINYVNVCFAVIFATLGSIWIKKINVIDSLTWNCFFVLIIAGMLFFGIYLCFLLWRREPLIIEIVHSVVEKIHKKARSDSNRVKD